MTNLNVVIWPPNSVTILFNYLYFQFCFTTLNCGMIHVQRIYLQNPLNLLITPVILNWTPSESSTHSWEGRGQHYKLLFPPLPLLPVRQEIDNLLLVCQITNYLIPYSMLYGRRGLLLYSIWIYLYTCIYAICNIYQGKFAWIFDS